MMNYYNSSDEYDSELCNNGEYIVERIEKRRILPNGKLEYFLKWKNWSSRHNTWEPEEHLTNCANLIDEFLLREKAKQYDDNNNRQKMPTKNRIKLEIPEICGFDKGYEAEHILGATDCNGLTFLIKFKGIDKTELVPSRIARYRCPHLVISFFEKHITWHSVNKRKN